MDRICFERPTFNMYLFILACIVSYLLYFKLSEHYQVTKIDPPFGSSATEMPKDKLYDKVLELKDSLHDSQLKEQKCQIQLDTLKNNINVSSQGVSVQPQFLEKIYNPLSGTSPLYPGGSFANPRGYDGYRQFQQLGYISGGPNGPRYPIMGRYRDAGRSDRFEYYFIDNERGRIKVPFKTKNYNELYDGDNVNIDELGGEFTFKKYEDTDGNRYSPDIF
jgi:hypothetical protein